MSNVGRDANWFGNHMSQANLYGFGRLAWDAELTSKQIIDEWTRLTFGTDSKVVDTVNDIQLKSWRVFENYTGPLGLQTLTDIVGNHYGVSVEASERNGWGQWHRADENGVGMDRRVETGTGFIGQYSTDVRGLRVAATHAGRSRPVHAPPALHLQVEVGKDRHSVHLRLALRRRRRGGRLGAQLENAGREGGCGALRRHPETARVPGGPGSRLARRRGTVVQPHLEGARWQGRVGTYPGRMEAEGATLDGYTAAPVTPWEAGSGEGAVECKAQKCTATFNFTGSAGRYDVIVQYFDVN